MEVHVTTLNIIFSKHVSNRSRLFERVPLKPRRLLMTPITIIYRC